VISWRRLWENLTPREICAVDANPAVAAARRQMQANFAIHVN
jgi:hypothetical protein